MFGPGEKRPSNEGIVSPNFRAMAASSEAVREQTARILKSEPFIRAPRMQCFLDFVVEESLAGRSAQLKEYTIAMNVFGRQANFDPRECPVVRVEAGRLR